MRNTGLLVVCVFLFSSFGGFSQQLQQLQRAPIELSSAVERGVIPQSPTTVYANPPSEWFSNWFNRTSGQTPTNITLRITDARTLTTFHGTELWVRVLPDDGMNNKDADPQCFQNGGCWLLLGILVDPLSVNSSNFLVSPQE